ncbi:polysaccharide deacetylase family protein [Pseudenhygromyxa sp. WMMC2535]|uniref:polysaccharide deacetylase family protein n=1 Tax=Pseudenhygromyxa sp. WMMC2535 TaxID=2712867 RepID=UPI001555585B|nr:polysaccharide deacetylase family protein [Pseudenhygromyxa sp. WMMC2535]NVB37449.1 polysaccharide deacetylase family protein [Pseudenhygromyxa sp. WMMC2535]
MSTIVSLDLDDLDCYHAIHGLDAPAQAQGAQPGLALERWLPRFLDVFAAKDVRATIFVIGKDLERDLRERGGRGAEVLARAKHDGHELANHGYAHAYDMVRWSEAEIAEDLRRCDDLLRELGAAPKGFRAPGYTHDRRMLLQVAGLGYRYDSSLLPSPTYYLGKLGVMGLRRLRGRKSVSQRGGASSFLGNTAVHLLPELGLWEIPISVSRALRLPLIGTFLLPDAPPMMTRLQGEALRREAAQTRHLHVELHAIDLADPEADGLDSALVRAARELGTPLDRRLERLTALLAARGGGTSIARAMNRSL